MGASACNDLLYLTVSIVSLFFCLVWFKSKRFDPRVPHGTLGWIFIGESLEFILSALTPHPERFMDKRIKRYGKVFRSHLLGSKTIVSTDAEVSRLVLQNDGRTFVPFYPKSIRLLMGDNSILLINGGLQKRIHGLVGGFLKSERLKAQITEDIEEYVRVNLKSWEDGQLVYIQEEAKHIAFQVLVKALISLGPGKDLDFLRKQFREFTAGLISMPLNLPGTRLYRSSQAKKKMAKMVQTIVSNKRSRNQTRSGGSNSPRDVLDALLDDPSQQLTVEMISHNLIDMMIPGEDSVPILITLAVKYLSDYPHVYREFLEENLKLKNSKEQLCWADYLSLPFTQNVITETLRMGNIIVGVMRKVMKDVEIKGYYIPKGWCVFTYFRSVHLDEQNYEDAHNFNPWRWQDKDPASSFFTPFGGGHRLCPGEDLARLEAAIFLHHLVTNYRWVAEEDRVVNFPTVKMRRKLPIRVEKLQIP